MFALTVASAQAQIQTAGNVFVDIDATVLPAGQVTDITNSGTLGGFFETCNSSGAPTTNGLIVVTNGVAGISLTTSYVMQLRSATNAGPLIPPPAGVVGPNATTTIEIWAMNPSVATDECMVSWGNRGFAGQNMAFEYGYDGNLGAVTHTTAPDLAWDPLGGCPLNNYWHHLVYTYNGTNESVYVDGALANSKVGAVNIATNAGIMLGAQWTNNGTGISTAPALATLFIARLRIHDEALTSAQVLNNYNTEKALYYPSPVTPQFLTSAPIHRYSFNEPPTSDATGLAIHDSIGGADGVVRGTNTQTTAQFARGRLILPASETGTRTGPQMLAAYGDLPNGLLSNNSTNKGGSGEMSVEIWYKNLGGVSSARVFDFGSCGLTTSTTGLEVPDIGNRPSNDSARDYLFYSSVIGTALNERRLSYQNFDTLPVGTTTNSVAPASDVFTMKTHQTDRHIVVTWKESTGKIIAYENGLSVATITVSNSMNSINDVNVWLGRSMLTDAEFAGEFDEVRFYTNVLTPGQVLGDFQVGPDTVNTAEQAAALVAQPVGASVLQGDAVTFNVLASGSPAVSYQWQRNGTNIAGATANTYLLASATMANNGDNFTCIVSNFSGGSSHAITSSPALITVTPNQAPPAQFLHETRDGIRDNYNTASSGEVGGLFTAGANGAVVTHFGFYDMNKDGLNRAHRVGLFNTSGSNVVFATVPAGTDGYLTNGYRYVALDSPFFLQPNTSYILIGEVFSGDGDGWPDVFGPGFWNPYFVGSNDGTTRQGRFGSGVFGTSPASTSTVNFTYAAPNLASLPIGPVVAAMPQASVTNYQGLSYSLVSFVNGQAPVSVQWYKDGNLLPGQTNVLLNFATLSTNDSGDYYVIANNSANSPVQSSNVTLTVLSGIPVSIAQQPSSILVPEGFPATFSVTSGGTPPFSYQWRLNGSAIAGATNSAYTVPSVSMAMNGNIFSVLVTNIANGVTYSTNSGTATLAVQPNKALPAHFLHETRDGFRDDYNGNVGGNFLTGGSDALVTHLGFYDVNGDGLNTDHHVGIFATNGTLLVQAVVSAGQNNLLTNGYRWVQLDTPFVLTNGSSYYLGAEVFPSDGDAWTDVFAATNWDPYFVGANDGSTRGSRFAGGAWPVSPTSGIGGANTAYAAANLAVLPVGTPVALARPSSITVYETQSARFTGVAEGAAPMTLQWYKNTNSPVLLAGQTNSTLTLSNLTVGDSDDYFIAGINDQGAGNSPGVHLTVLALTSPIILQQPASQTVYAHQRAVFSVQAIGQQPLIYQWSFNNSPIGGATNSSYQVSNSGSANAGNYTVSISNTLGSTNSTAANLQVTPLPSGSYASAVTAAGPLIYYRFSEVGNDTNAFNLGSLGISHDGVYEGTTYYGTPGPVPPDFANMEDTNLAVYFDRNGFGVANSDVSIPALNIDTSGGAHATLAAWINSAGQQAPFAGIVFNRGVSGANGFGVKTNADGIDELEYHWNNTYFTFESGLLVPQNQWIFAAVVIEPTKATFYSFSNGSTPLTATNVAAHTAVPFADVTYIGWDTSAANRRFYGAIDEPMIFNKSLTADQIQTLYNASHAAVIGDVTISAAISGNNKIILTWPSGVLQRAPSANGPYADDLSATSPYTVNTTGTREFFRVRVQ